jgi:hypothetical protein
MNRQTQNHLRLSSGITEYAAFLYHARSYTLQKDKVYEKRSADRWPHYRSSTDKHQFGLRQQKSLVTAFGQLLSEKFVKRQFFRKNKADKAVGLNSRHPARVGGGGEGDTVAASQAIAGLDVRGTKTLDKALRDYSSERNDLKKRGGLPIAEYKILLRR